VDRLGGVPDRSGAGLDRSGLIVDRSNMNVDRLGDFPDRLCPILDRSRVVRLRLRSIEYCSSSPMSITKYFITYTCFVTHPYRHYNHLQKKASSQHHQMNDAEENR